MKLGSIITTAKTEPELKLAMGWLESAKNVYVYSEFTAPSANGLQVIKGKALVPTLKQIIAEQLGRIRGREFIGLVMPTIVLPKDFTILTQLTGSSAMELNWAFRAKASTASWQPELMIITTALLPHILKDAPDDLLFQGTSWAIWLDEWCKKTMLPHKFIDVSAQLKLAELQPQVTATIPMPKKPIRKVIKK